MKKQLPRAAAFLRMIVKKLYTFCAKTGFIIRFCYNITKGKDWENET